MARDKITIQIPKITNTTPVGSKVVEKQTVTQANGVVLEKAAECMNNTLMILITNTASAASSVTFKKGDQYPNAILGDLTLPLTQAAETVCIIQDPSRFMTKAGSIELDFATGFSGTIAAIGKGIGIAQ